LSVVVPCCNEEAVLPQLRSRLDAVCRQQTGDSFEVILVNAGSRDSTWPVLQTIVRDTPGFVGVNLSRNLRHSLALTAGLSLSRGERVLIIDADLQVPPELLPQMMAAMDAGADVVDGQRRERQGESLSMPERMYRWGILVGRALERPPLGGPYAVFARKSATA